MLSHLSVLVSVTLLLSQEAVCSTNYTLNVNLTTNSPLNCSAGLTYPGVFLTVEYQILKNNGKDQIIKWTEIGTIILEPVGSTYIYVYRHINHVISYCMSMLHVCRLYCFLLYCELSCAVLKYL